MNKQLKSYLSKIDSILLQNKPEQLQEIISKHLQQIYFYQHERLIHLIVTGIFSLLSMICFIGAIISSHVELLILFCLLLCLLIPYIFYYYSLENGVPKMYDQYWKLKEKE